MADTFDCTKLGTLKSTPYHSMGADVRELQTQLKAWGFYTSTIDGDYGPVTATAVKAFQKKHGLTQDGQFGPKESCPKFNELVNKAAATTTTTQDTKTTYKITCTDINLYNGNKNNNAEVVKQLQTYMKQLTYYTREVDGDYGYYTEEAVKAFQKQWNKDNTSDQLAVDGKFGPVTCERLKKIIEKIGTSTTNNATEQSKKTEPPKVDPYKPDPSKNVFSVDEAQISIDGIFLKIHKFTPNNRFHGGNWKTIDLIQGYKTIKTKPKQLEFTIESNLTNKQYTQLHNELEKIGNRICNVVSTQLPSSKYFVEVDSTPLKLTHQKVTMKLTEYLTE